MSRIKYSEDCKRKLRNYHEVCKFTKKEVGTFDYNKPYKIIDLYKIFYLISQNNLQKTKDCARLRTNFTNDCVPKKFRDRNHEYFIDMLNYTLQTNNSIKKIIDIEDALHNLETIVKHLNLNIQKVIDYELEEDEEDYENEQKEKIEFESLYINKLDDETYEIINKLAKNKNVKDLKNIKTYWQQQEIYNVRQALRKIKNLCLIIDSVSEYNNLCSLLDNEINDIETKLDQIEEYNDEKFEDLKNAAYNYYFNRYYPPKSPVSPQSPVKPKKTRSSRGKKKLDFSKTKQQEEQEALEASYQLAEQERKEISSSQEKEEEQVEELYILQGKISSEVSQENKTLEKQKLELQKDKIYNLALITNYQEIEKINKNYYEGVILPLVSTECKFEVEDRTITEKQINTMNQTIDLLLTKLKNNINSNKNQVEYIDTHRKIIQILQNNIISIFDYQWSKFKEQQISCDIHVLESISFLDNNDYGTIFYKFLKTYLNMCLIITLNCKKVQTPSLNKDSNINILNKLKFIRLVIRKYYEKILNNLSNEDTKKSIIDIYNYYDLFEVFVEFKKPMKFLRTSVYLQHYIHELNDIDKYFSKFIEVDIYNKNHQIFYQVQSYNSITFSYAVLLQMKDDDYSIKTYISFYKDNYFFNNIYYTLDYSNFENIYDIFNDYANFINKNIDEKIINIFNSDLDDSTKYNKIKDLQKIQSYGINPN